MVWPEKIRDFAGVCEAVEITESFKALLPMLGEQLKPVMAPAAAAPAAAVAPADPPKN